MRSSPRRSGIQFTGLKYQIEKLRSSASIQGYVITELTDIYWEANGLMDMERNLRAFHAPFADVNADIVIVPGCRRWGYWAGETLDLALVVATGGGFVGPDAVLDWTLEPFGLAGRVPVAAAGPNRVVADPGLDVVVPDLTAAVAATLRLTLRDAKGATIARNYEALSVYPRAHRAAAVRGCGPTTTSCAIGSSRSAMPSPRRRDGGGADGRRAEWTPRSSSASAAAIAPWSSSRTARATGCAPTSRRR